MKTDFFVPEISKQNNFTLLRMLCCLIIIYEHSVFLSNSSYINLNLCWYAVRVFFILSGFWVTFSLLRSKSLKEYALKRFKKIFPLYWTIVIGFALILSSVSSLSFYEYFKNIDFYKYLAANLSTLNFLCQSLPGVFEGLPLEGAVNGALWTIKVEVGFYIILPFILFLINKFSKKFTENIEMNGLIILFIIFILSVTYSVLCDFVCKHYGLSDSLKHQLPAFMTYFVCGMTFCLYWEKLETLLNYLIFPAFIIIILIKFMPVEFISYIFIPICLSIVVFWFGTHIIFFSSLCKDDYSYGMYLIHVPFLMLCVQYGYFESNFYFALFLVFSASFLCSYLWEKHSKK
ncbi:MAG: acyltransferase [Treponema sp.]|nr:acyltransferase [Treponema sp.]